MDTMPNAKAIGIRHLLGFTAVVAILAAMMHWTWASSDRAGAFVPVLPGVSVVAITPLLLFVGIAFPVSMGVCVWQIVLAPTRLLTLVIVVACGVSAVCATFDGDPSVLLRSVVMQGFVSLLVVAESLVRYRRIDRPVVAAAGIFAAVYCVWLAGDIMAAV